jgi:hypothetical protein
MFAHIIQNPAKAKMSEKSVMEGIIRSSALTPTQRSDIDGIIKSSIPSEKKKGHSEIVAPVGELSEPNATKSTIGLRRFPGSKYH